VRDGKLGLDIRFPAFPVRDLQRHRVMFGPQVGLLIVPDIAFHIQGDPSDHPGVKRLLENGFLIGQQAHEHVLHDILGCVLITRQQRRKPDQLIVACGVFLSEPRWMSHRYPLPPASQ